MQKDLATRESIIIVHNMNSYWHTVESVRLYWYGDMGYHRGIHKSTVATNNFPAIVHKFQSDIYT